MSKDITKDIARLEKRLFNPRLPEWQRKEAYQEILKLVSGKWRERVEHLEGLLEKPE